jgi:hypothetical protein
VLSKPAARGPARLLRVVGAHVVRTRHQGFVASKVTRALRGGEDSAEALRNLARALTGTAAVSWGGHLVNGELLPKNCGLTVASNWVDPSRGVPIRCVPVLHSPSQSMVSV